MTWFLHFSILSSRFWIITIIILNCFSGCFLISSSIWTLCFLVVLFCAVFFCLSLFIFNLLCFGLDRLQGWIIFSFWFLPSWGGSRGLCKLLVGCDLCSHSGWRRWVIFCFCFSLMYRLVEVVILLYCFRFCFCLVCCLDEASWRVLLTIWVMLGLVESGCLLRDFSLFDAP